MSIESCGLLDDEQDQGDGEESDKNEWIEETVEKESVVVGNKTYRIERGRGEGGSGRGVRSRI